MGLANPEILQAAAPLKWLGKYAFRRRSPLLALLEHPEAGVDDVPVQIGAHNVAGVALRVIVPSAAMEQPDVVEGQHVAGLGLEGVGIVAGQSDEARVGLVPGQDLLQRHIEVAVALGHTVVHPGVPTLGIQTEEKSYFWFQEQLTDSPYDRRPPDVVELPPILAAYVVPVHQDTAEALKVLGMIAAQDVRYVEGVHQEVAAPADSVWTTQCRMLTLGLYS